MTKYLFMLVLLFSFGCTKFGKNVTVTGRVVNPITGEGISGIKLELWRDASAAPGTLNSSSKIIEETISDENGYFKIDKLASRKPWLRAVMGETPYYKIGWYVDNAYTGNINDLHIKKGKKMEAEYHMVPYGYYHSHTKNISCFNEFDHVAVYFDSAQFNARGNYAYGLSYE